MIIPLYSKLSVVADTVIFGIILLDRRPVNAHVVDGAKPPHPPMLK